MRLRRALLASAFLLPTSHADTVPTNHTIDDAGPLVEWVPDTQGLCIGCGGSSFDASQLHNGTVTEFANTTPNQWTLGFNFTGTAIYIFFALPSDAAPQAGGFRLDTTQLGIFDFTSPGTDGQYNMLAYSNTSIPDGTHRFFIDVSPSQQVNFDYAIYTSNDPASSPTATTAPADQISTHQQSMAAVAGGTVGVLVLLGIAVALVFFCFHGRKRQKLGRVAAETKVLSSDHIGSTQSPRATPRQRHNVRVDLEVGAVLLDNSDTDTAGEVERLRAQIQRLVAERGEGGVSSVASTDATAGARRSLSTMKRAQTQAIREHETGYAMAADTLVHTDSGLRLTAGRVVEELPPTYVPE
ncbi:hypothetical protein FB451DRAFT_707408 [Mycena latifolia]|nr:hypothetical protein FB451DRAFT_707408 [Mycena latifolia]